MGGRAAGGIGTPEAAAAAFVLGADFILTGSVNQCTAEAGTSDAGKDILQNINVQDTDYAPEGNMFEMGVKIQVVKKGLFFLPGPTNCTTFITTAIPWMRLMKKQGTRFRTVKYLCINYVTFIVGATPCGCPPYKGRHRGLPLH